MTNGNTIDYAIFQVKDNSSLPVWRETRQALFQWFTYARLRGEIRATIESDHEFLRGKRYRTYDDLCEESEDMTLVSVRTLLRGGRYV